MDRKVNDLAASSRMLETLSYKSVLKRGYAVVRDDNGQTISKQDAIKAAKTVHIEVEDGTATLSQK